MSPLVARRSTGSDWRSRGAESPGVRCAEEQERAREKEFVRRLRAGDEEAYRLLLERYGGRMLSVARGVLRDEQEALDARQDALLSLLRSLDGFAGEALVGTWLHRILINACLMRLRSRRRRGPAVSLEEIGGEEPTWLKPCRSQLPPLWECEERMQRDALRRRVRVSLGGLPPRHWQVILLRDLQERSTREVAGLLGISENAVKVRLHRARRAARRVLAGDNGGERPASWRRRRVGRRTEEEAK